MSKLTKAQIALLQDMAAVTNAKSGNFWLDLGNPIQTLTSLERRGYVKTVDLRATPSRSSYSITPEGLAALGEAHP